MKLLTKEQRDRSRQAQFENLIQNGYDREIYKGLDIFTTNEGKLFTLKIFRGNASKHILYINYRTEQSRSEAMQRAKESYDRLEAYKADRKEKNQGRLTGAAACADAIRAELKAKLPGYKFSVRSETFSGGDAVRVSWDDGLKTDEVNTIISKYQYGQFDGMTDIYKNTNNRDDIPQAKYITTSRHMSEELKTVCLPYAERFFENDKYRGIHDVSQFLCSVFYASSIPTGATVTGIRSTGKTCGINRPEEFYKIAYTLPETKEAPKATAAPAEVPAGKVQIIDYSEKAIAVIGDFSKHYDKLIGIGGKYNSRLSCGKGIIFSKRHLEAVKAVLLSATDETPTQTKTELKPSTGFPQAEVTNETYKKAKAITELPFSDTAHQEEEVRNAASACIFGKEKGYTIHTDLIKIVNQATEETTVIEPEDTTLDEFTTTAPGGNYKGKPVTWKIKARGQCYKVGQEWTPTESVFLKYGRKEKFSTVFWTGSNGMVKVQQLNGGRYGDLELTQDEFLQVLTRLGSTVEIENFKKAAAAWNKEDETTQDETEAPGPTPPQSEPQPETYNSMEELNAAAQSGKVVSLFNMCQLINAN